MKKTKYLACFMIILSIMAVSVSALAETARASDQISMYWMDVGASKGSLDIEFSIKGVGTVDKLGCQSIYIYKHEGDSWRFVQSVLEDEPGMSKTNTFTHTNLICCDGEAGIEYKVIVKLFAENSAGRDVRSKTFYVTGE